MDESKRARNVVAVALVAALTSMLMGISATGVSVSGIIRHEGRPVSGVLISAQYGGHGHSATTGGDGHYRFEGVPPYGELQLNVRPPISMRLAQRNWETGQVRSDLIKDFDLVAGHRLQGTVRRPDGSPYSDGFWMGVEPVAGTIPAGEWLGDGGRKGRFDIVLPPDVYILKPHIDTYGLPVMRVDLRAQDVLDLSVVLSEDPIHVVQVDPPPMASLITIGTADATGIARIKGDAGAVPPLSSVVLIQLDSGLYVTVIADHEGAFSASLFCPPGSSLLVKYTYDVGHIRLLERASQPGVDEDMNAIGSLPGTILHVPMEGVSTRATTPFGASARTTSGPGRSDARWWIDGVLHTGSGLEVLPGDEVRVSGTLFIASEALSRLPSTPAFNAFCQLYLVKLFDAHGMSTECVTHGLTDHIFMASLLTPTGLPIERESAYEFPALVTSDLRSFSRAAPSVLETEVEMRAQIPSDLPPGMYALKLACHTPGLPADPSPAARVWSCGRHGHEAFLPILRIGEVEPPRMPTMILANTYAGGARGTVAREDAGRFDLSTMVVYQPERAIVPVKDAEEGSVSVRLEPFLPMISYTDRSFPNVPIVPFSLPSGVLEVTICKPDGSVDSLGPATFTQSYSFQPTTLAGGDLHLGAPYLADIYSLATLDDAFHHAFDQQGAYVIEVDSRVEDVWGHEYALGGIYDIWVGGVLDIESGQLPTTPYEVGDAFSPTIQVYPRVPAEVEIRLVLLPDSDPARRIEHIISGTANAFGYFHPGGGLDDFQFPSAGEFRVDIEANYVSADGRAWAGSRTWGNVVETPNTPLVVHGRHGIDNAPDIGLQWFLWRDLSEEDRHDHVYYPFHRGDVLWAKESEAPGGDSLTPAITIQDTVGQIESIIRIREQLPHSAFAQGPGTFEERVQASEMPLFSTASSGVYPDLFPDQIDQWGYSYRSSERPGVRVRELVSEDANLLGYWRYGDLYGGQIGMGHEGDLPHDIKWQFGGAVFREEVLGIRQYAIYSAFWVLVPEDDPLGTRLMPPYRGSGGGPQDGGPLLTMRGVDIDVLFLPMGIRPGSVLTVGDTISFSGHVAPALDSRVTATIVSPSGIERTIEGHANKIGWFYDPSADFVAGEAGVWSVNVNVEHDRRYVPGGLVPTAYNTGTVLGAESGTYRFYVIDSNASRLSVDEPDVGRLRWSDDGLSPIRICGTVSEPGQGPLYYTIAMPGVILEQGTVPMMGGRWGITYDPVKLHKSFPNIDLTAPEEWRPGLSDEILITFATETSDGRFLANSVTLFGEDLYYTQGGVAPGSDSLAAGDGIEDTAFIDEFEETLSSEWTWLDGSDAGIWSLTERPGALRITVQPSATKPPSGAVVVAAPAGDFYIETKVEFTPLSNFQRAGLLIYGNADNVLVLGRGFCSYTDSGCVLNGIYFDSSLSTANHATETPEKDLAWLRLWKRGQEVTAQYNEDGAVWQTIGVHSFPYTGALRVGLIADGELGATTGVPAYFDYYRLEERK